MTQWEQFVQIQRKLGASRPKLVCIDLQPYTTTQAVEKDDILNIGGFSDAVFSVVGRQGHPLSLARHLKRKDTGVYRAGKARSQSDESGYYELDS